MKTLCILRHAKSAWNQPELADHDRGLNNRGLLDAPRMGRHLAQRGIVPELLISSTAVRARTTARLLLEAMRLDASLCQLRDELYLASPRAIVALASETSDDIDTLMLCGHNPGMTEVVSLLTGEDFYHLPTAGLVTLAVDVASWSHVGAGCASVVHFDYPKNLPA